MKIQGADVKTLSDLGGAGNESKFITDDQIYISANSLNKTLKNAIIAANLGGAPAAATVTTNSTQNTYDMTSTALNTVIKHTAAQSVIYKLPSASSGSIKNFTFINFATNSTDGSAVVVTASSNDKIDFNSSANGNVTATLTAATYTHGSSGVSGSIGDHLKTQMQSADSGSTYTVTFDFPTKKYTVSRSAGTFFFKFSTGTNAATSGRKLIGFDGTDGTTAASQVGQVQLDNTLWIQPASGNFIHFEGKIIDNPGMLGITRRGLSVVLVNIDSNIWVVQSVDNYNHEKNTTVGQNKDVGLLGRNTWVSKTSSGSSNGGGANSELNAYYYNLGGDDGTTSYTGQYNDSQNSWTTKTSMPAGRETSFACSFNGYLFMGAGNVGGNNSSCIKFNDYTNAWTTIGNLTLARGHTSGGMLNGYAFCVGGFTGSDASTVDRYNDGTDTSVAKTSHPVTSRDFSSFVLAGYLYSGMSNGPRSDMYQYNDALDSWLQKTNAPAAVLDAATFVINQYGYIGGGNSSGTKTTTYEYNDSLNTWNTKANLVSTNQAPRSSAGVNGYGYATNGDSHVPVAASTHEQYN